MKRRRLLVMFLQIAAIAAISAGVVIIAAHLWPNAGGAATCFKTHCFCEADRSGAISQPINTLSSLAFVAVAAYAWLRMRDKRASSVFQSFIVGMIAVGLGSAYYHASLSFVGQLLDVTGMYFFGTVMICATLLRANKIRKAQAIVVFVACNSLLAIMQALVPDTRRFLFAALIIIALLLEFALRRKSAEIEHLLYALSLILIAYAIWLLDQLKIICFPTSLVQGHGIWHLLTAFATLQIIKYYFGNPKETV